MEYDAFKVQAVLNEIDGFSTAIIISAKHGQSPTDPNDLARVPDGPIIDAINAAWTAAHPGAGALVVFATDDDGMLLWLSDRSQAAADFVKEYLLTHTAAANNIGGDPITITNSGLKRVFAGHDGDDRQDRNVPILVVLPRLQHGHLIGAPVETTQIAPSILKLLGLAPRALEAVRIEHTRALPGI